MAARFNTADLPNTWIHSHEEDDGEIQVYRPPDYPLPPARGRDSLTLNSDGTLSRAVPGPDDRSRRMPAGSWKVEGHHLVLEQQGGEARKFVIESVAPDKLQLRALKTST